MINRYVNKLINNLPETIKNEHNPMKLDLVLDGGVFNGSYLLGALYFLKEMENKKYIKIERISGCSIGSLAAFVYFIDGLKIMDKLYDIFFENFKKNYNLHKILGLYSYLNDYIPENICEKVNGILYITYYNIKKNKKIVKNNYKNKKDIIDTIIRSCYIPYLIDGNKFYKNKYIDGINPFIFKLHDNSNNINKNKNNKINKKILYLDLFGYDKIYHLLNVKNEKTNYHRILTGLLDIHNFFIKESSTTMCSYVNNWSIMDKFHIYIKIIFEKIIIYIIILINYLNKYIGKEFSNSIIYRFVSKIIYDFYIILLDTYCL